MGRIHKRTKRVGCRMPLAGPCAQLLRLVLGAFGHQLSPRFFLAVRFEFLLQGVDLGTLAISIAFSDHCRAESKSPVSA